MKEKKQLNIDIGERIRSSRELSGYTQERLADAVGVTVQYISDLERGVVGTSIPTLIKISETLKTSCDYILMGKTEKNNVSDIFMRLQYLDDYQIKLVEESINLLISAFEHKK